MDRLNYNKFPETNSKSLVLIDRARNIMNQFRKDMAEKHKQENVEIIKAIEATRETFAKLKEKDMEYHKELKEFIDEIKPYLDPNERPNFGAVGTQYQMLFNSIMNPNQQTRMIVLNTVREDMFDIDGLITEPKESQKSRMEKERFNLK